jgi:hypothetical protein
MTPQAIGENRGEGMHLDRPLLYSAASHAETELLNEGFVFCSLRDLLVRRPAILHGNDSNES